MRLSTRAQYGTRALLDIAVHGKGKPVQMKDIARRQQIPLPYLGHLLAPLVGAGIIRSKRGGRGGISIARPLEEIKLSEVIQLLEGSMALVECVNDPEYCPRFALCVTRDIWGELKKAMDEVLESTTLQDLVERQKRKEPQEAIMYNI